MSILRSYLWDRTGRATKHLGSVPAAQRLDKAAVDDGLWALPFSRCQTFMRALKAHIETSRFVGETNGMPDQE